MCLSKMTQCGSLSGLPLLKRPWRTPTFMGFFDSVKPCESLVLPIPGMGQRFSPNNYLAEGAEQKLQAQSQQTVAPTAAAPPWDVPGQNVIFPSFQ